MTEILELLEKAGVLISLFAVAIIIAGFVSAAWRYARRFEDHSDFSRMFRRIGGLTPRAFRQASRIG